MIAPLKTKLYYGLGKYLPFLKLKPPEADRQATLRLRPLRHPSLSSEKRETGETILIVPQNDQVGRITRTMARWLRVPMERKVELDEVGGFVWELCDGNHTIESVVQKTSKHYKMNRREAEVSVTMFLQMLHERKFIGFYKKEKPEQAVPKKENRKQETVGEQP